MGKIDRFPIDELEKDGMRGLLDVYGMLLLTIDGMWIQEVERRYGTEICLQIYTDVMARYGVIEARRISKFLNINPGNLDIPTMIAAYNTLPWGRVGPVEYEQVKDKEVEIRIIDCHPQAARRARGQPMFPCQQLEKAELESFFKYLNPKVKVDCIFCPPDHRPADVPERVSCCWKVVIES
jgi:hypothetical protein